jgi:hypothetical protein
MARKLPVATGLQVGTVHFCFPRCSRLNWGQELILLRCGLTKNSLTILAESLLHPSSRVRFTLCALITSCRRVELCGGREFCVLIHRVMLNCMAVVLGRIGRVVVASCVHTHHLVLIAWQLLVVSCSLLRGMRRVLDLRANELGEGCESVVLDLLERSTWLDALYLAGEGCKRRHHFRWSVSLPPSSLPQITMG